MFGSVSFSQFYGVLLTKTLPHLRIVCEDFIRNVEGSMRADGRHADAQSGKQNSPHAAFQQPQ